MPTSGTAKGGNPSPDPFLNFNFMVEIDGVITAGFHDCSGLDSTVEVIEHREGGQNTTNMKIPGQTKFSNIVLQRGLYEQMELYHWHKSTIEGPPDPKSVSIGLYNRQGAEVSRCSFYRAW